MKHSTTARHAAHAHVHVHVPSLLCTGARLLLLLVLLIATTTAASLLLLLPLAILQHLLVHPP
jgi:hypothetical protein